MGLFDKFKNEKKENKIINASGWDAIDEEAKRIYPGQDNPKHYEPLIKWCFGGSDPLDGISVYDGGDYWHFVTYGLSELYDKESDDKEWSGYGMEFTFKIKKDSYADEEYEIKCICGLLQQIARLTFESGEIFNPFEYLYQPLYQIKHVLPSKHWKLKVSNDESSFWKCKCILARKS